MIRNIQGKKTPFNNILNHKKRATEAALFRRKLIGD